MKKSDNVMYNLQEYLQKDCPTSSRLTTYKWYGWIEKNYKTTSEDFKLLHLIKFNKMMLLRENRQKMLIWKDTVGNRASRSPCFQLADLFLTDLSSSSSHEK
jgi:hypothetical protein